MCWMRLFIRRLDYSCNLLATAVTSASKNQKFPFHFAFSEDHSDCTGAFGAEDIVKKSFAKFFLKLTPKGFSIWCKVGLAT